MFERSWVHIPGGDAACRFFIFIYYPNRWKAALINTLYIVQRKQKNICLCTQITFLPGFFGGYWKYGRAVPIKSIVKKIFTHGGVPLAIVAISGFYGRITGYSGALLAFIIYTISLDYCFGKQRSVKGLVCIKRHSCSFFNDWFCVKRCFELFGLKNVRPKCEHVLYTINFQDT